MDSFRWKCFIYLPSSVCKGNTLTISKTCIKIDAKSFYIWELFPKNNLRLELKLNRLFSGLFSYQRDLKTCIEGIVRSRENVISLFLKLVTSKH